MMKRAVDIPLKIREVPPYPLIDVVIKGPEPSSLISPMIPQYVVVTAPIMIQARGYMYVSPSHFGS